MIRVSLVLHTIVPNDAFGAAKTVIKPLETELVQFGLIHKQAWRKTSKYFLGVGGGGGTSKSHN